MVIEVNVKKSYEIVVIMTNSCVKNADSKICELAQSEIICDVQYIRHTHTALETQAFNQVYHYIHIL